MCDHLCGRTSRVGMPCSVSASAVCMTLKSSRSRSRFGSRLAACLTSVDFGFKVKVKILAARWMGFKVTAAARLLLLKVSSISRSRLFSRSEAIDFQGQGQDLSQEQAKITIQPQPISRSRSRKIRFNVKGTALARVKDEGRREYYYRPGNKSSCAGVSHRNSRIGGPRN